MSRRGRLRDGVEKAIPGRRVRPAVGPAERLRDRIAAAGPMPFATWMEEALYGAGGYYMRPGRKTGRGSDADFATSPTLHPFLARAVAAEVRAVWRRLGRPAGFAVAEFGGGEGDLARDALAFLDANQRDLSLALPWLHVEMSPEHRRRQTGDARLVHVDAIPDGFVGVIVAHEFLDALPFRWLERTEDGWSELHVGLDGQRFTLEPRPTGLAGPEDAPPGQRVVVMERARLWLQDNARRLARGAMLVVDYGGDHVWRRGGDGTVRAFRGHQLVEDVLAAPGEQDITASVDFAALRAWAEADGLWVATEESQQEFLVRHGVLEHLNAMDKTTVEAAGAYLRLRQVVFGVGAAYRVLRLEKDVPPDARGPPGDEP